MNKKGQIEDIFGDLLPAIIVIIICLFVLGIANSQKAETLNSKIYASQSNMLLKNDISVLLDSEKEGVSIKEAIIALPSAENKEEFKEKYIDEPFADLFNKINSAPIYLLSGGFNKINSALIDVSSESYALKITYPNGDIIRVIHRNWEELDEKDYFLEDSSFKIDEYNMYEYADIMINENIRLQFGAFWSRKT